MILMVLECKLGYFICIYEEVQYIYDKNDYFKGILYILNK